MLDMKSAYFLREKQIAYEVDTVCVLRDKGKNLKLSGYA